MNSCAQLVDRRPKKNNQNPRFRGTVWPIEFPIQGVINHHSDRFHISPSKLINPLIFSSRHAKNMPARPLV
jgi:hypothetical protein